ILIIAAIALAPTIASAQRGGMGRGRGGIGGVGGIGGAGRGAGGGGRRAGMGEGGQADRGLSTDEVEQQSGIALILGKKAMLALSDSQVARISAVKQAVATKNAPL